MRLPSLNNRAAVMRYFADFERRFVPAGDTVIYQRVGGDAVRLTRELAAELIAGMRATLFEVDAANPLWGAQALFAAPAAVMLIVIFGTIAGFLAVASALIVPAIVVVLLAGPGLGHLRAAAAWRRGLAEVERRIAGAEPVDEAALRVHAPANPVRPVFMAVAVLTGAALLGLTFAGWGLPAFERTRLDRVIAQATWPVVLLVVGLGLASYAFDAIWRRRVSEAEIAAAMARNEGRPLG